jgi:hypothetical protein
MLGLSMKLQDFHDEIVQILEKTLKSTDDGEWPFSETLIKPFTANADIPKEISQ